MFVKDYSLRFSEQKNYIKANGLGTVMKKYRNPGDSEKQE